MFCVLNGVGIFVVKVGVASAHAHSLGDNTSPRQASPLQP